MEHAPHPKGGKIAPIQKVSVAKWDSNNELTLTVKVNPNPPLSASGKCYMLAFKQGETDIVVEVGGVKRKVRLSLMLYAKVPASERRANLAVEAEKAELAGEPRLH